jgi:hypothetical protein
MTPAPTERLSRNGAARDISVSFEFFPPKTEEAEKTLWECITRLLPLEPQFVSVTYGAGGSTRERTHQTVTRLVRESDVPPAAHLTCVAASKAEVDRWRAAIGMRACAISWHCAAIRPAASAPPMSRIRRAMRIRAIWSPG